MQATEAEHAALAGGKPEAAAEPEAASPEAAEPEAAVQPAAEWDGVTINEDNINLRSRSGEEIARWDFYEDDGIIMS